VRGRGRPAADLPPTHSRRCTQALALAHGVCECLRGFFQRRPHVIAVCLVQVAVVGLRAAQRAIFCPKNMFTAQPWIVVRLGTSRAQDLRKDFERQPRLAFQRLAEHRFCPRVSAEVGRVEGTYARSPHTQSRDVVLDPGTVGKPVAVGDF